MAMPTPQSDVVVLCANFADLSDAEDMVRQLDRRDLRGLFLLTPDTALPMGDLPLLYIVFVGKTGWDRRQTDVAREILRQASTCIVFSNNPSQEAQARTETLLPGAPIFDLQTSDGLDFLAARIAEHRKAQRQEEVQPAEKVESLGPEERNRVIEDLLHRQVLEPLGITDPSPGARFILASAVHPLSPGSRQGELSTTSLLIAIEAAATTVYPDGEETLPCRAVAYVLRRFPGVAANRDAYLRSKGPFGERIDGVLLSSNMRPILLAAQGSGRLTADGLVNALLNRAGTTVEGWLREAGVSFDDLRTAVAGAKARGGERESSPPNPPPEADDGAWPESQREQVAAIQTMLRDRELPAGASDGLLGPATRSAIREFERRAGLKESGEPSRELFEALKEGRSAKPPSPPPAQPPPSSSSTLSGFDVSLPSLNTDNPNQGASVDRLGVEDEAKAFARVATARQVMPPLAFGVFGDWGSGKSFFMRLMQNHVERLSSGTAEEFDEKLFHRYTVQIRFNAWHYVDTNLWASLIDHIFIELDRWAVRERSPAGQNTLFDKLATARELTFESAERLMRRRREQKDAAANLEGARKNLATAREEASKSAGTGWATAKRLFWTDERRREIGKLARSLGLEQAAQDMQHFETALKDLRDQGTRAKVEAEAFRKRLWSAPWLIVTLAAITLVPLAAVAGREFLMDTYQQTSWLQWLFGKLNETTLGLSGVLVAATGAVKWASLRVGWGIARVQGMQKDLDDAIAQQTVEDQKKVAEAEEALKKQTTQVAEAEAVLASTRDKLAEAAREYASGTGRARLLHFVRDRVTDGQYAKHLGLVATARKDFTELSAMMSEPDPELLAAQKRELEVFRSRVAALKTLAEADGLLTEDERTQLDAASAEPTPDNEPTFERIILYVDDLDRCPPPTVVAVLQAVHLLLTFPLFVVVVAVDTRWVSRSLVSHYDKLLHQGAIAPGEMEGAAPRDYLEKIFQVPYRVRPMTDKASSALVTGLVAPPPPPPPPPPPASPPPGDPAGGAALAGPAGANMTPGNAAASPTAMSPASPPATPPPPSPPSPSGPSSSGTPPPASTIARQVAGALVLTPEERAFMRALAPLVGDTPRRALRFVNVYRVIKASLGRNDLHDIRENGAYRALMTELAVTTGVPDLQEKWWSFVDQVKDDEPGKVLAQRAKAPDWFTDKTKAERRLRSILDLLVSDTQPLEEDGPPVERDTAVRAVITNGGKHLRYYSSIARRYSFRD